MIIIEILWHIKRGQEDTFQEAWKKDFTVSDKTKLIGEFLCSPNANVEDRFKSWKIEQFDQPEEQVTAFLNVALWDSFEAFLAEISKHIPKPGAPKPPFEVARYRVLLEPIAWRRGESNLPMGNSSGTL